MSVNHNMLIAGAVKFRWTRSSWTGGPGLRLSPRFFERTDQMRCNEHRRCTRFSLAT
jgi:hypothetical protein